MWITSAAIPGVVFGLAYVIYFKRTVIYGTIIILAIVNLVHFIASPYLIIYNSLLKINENLEAVASTMGIGRFHMIKDILVPMCKNSLYENVMYFEGNKNDVYVEVAFQHNDSYTENVYSFVTYPSFPFFSFVNTCTSLCVLSTL